GSAERPAEARRREEEAVGQAPGGGRRHRPEGPEDRAPAGHGEAAPVGGAAAGAGRPASRSNVRAFFSHAELHLRLRVRPPPFRAACTKASKAARARFSAAGSPSSRSAWW